MHTFPVISPWIALPITIMLMILSAVHARRTRASAEPASRKRIRIANAMLMMLTLPLVAVGFSIVSPRTHPREWILIWMAAMALLTMNVALACLDVINTVRLLRTARRRLRAEMILESLSDARSPPFPTASASPHQAEFSTEGNRRANSAPDSRTDTH